MDEVIKKRKVTFRSFLAVGLLVFVAVVYWLTSGGQQVRNYNVDGSRLTYSRVQFGEFKESIPLYGHIAPMKTVFLDATRGGVVDEIYIREGDNVEQGTPILRFINTDFTLQIYSQEARIAEQLDINSSTRMAMDQNRLEVRRTLNDIELNLSLRERELTRLAQLKEKGFVANHEYQAAKDHYNFLVKSREINLEAQKQDEELREQKIVQLSESAERLNEHLKAIRETSNQLVVRAPIAGQVTSLPIDIGESKSMGERLGQIDAFGGYMVIAYADSFYLQRIQVGQLANFSYSNNNFLLKIDRIYPEIKDGRFRLDLSFENSPPNNIRRGQNANLELQLGQQQETLLVDKGGFLQDTGGAWVFVVSESGGLAKKRNIKLGRQNTNFIEVLSGLEKGEKIITSSYANFLDMNQLTIR